MTTKLSDLHLPCEVCGFYEPGEHFDQVGDWCDGAGSRPVEVSDLLEALRAEGVGEVRHEGPALCRHGESNMHVSPDGESACAGPIAGKRRVLVVPLGEDA